MPRPTQDTHKIYKTVPIRDFHSLWCVFPNTSNPALQPISGSYYPHIAVTIWVWAAPISLATTLGITFVFFSSAYLDVSVQRVPGRTLWIYVRSLQVFCSRFPHSEICGSIDICSSPQLIAAYHVLHRLLVPRHPPYALFCLTSYMLSSVRTCGLVNSALTELRII